MDLDKITIEKRDGKHEAFSKEKIKNAITKAYRASDVKEEPGVIDQVTDAVCNSIDKDIISVEEIQDLVEHELMFRNHHVAKKYILYRDQRNTERHKRTHMKHVMDGIVNIEKNDVNLSNANMSSHTPAGQMMTFASEVTKDYTIKYLLSPKFARAHKEGDIHIHDLDYYPTKTVTCVQYDLADIFERGFKTKNGSIRTPQSIRSYATLATIVFQTNQNEQHGGQSIPAFDFFMAPGVYKTFIKSAEQMIMFLCKIKHKDMDFSFLRDMLKENIKSIDVTDEEKNNLVAMLSGKGINISLDELSVIVNNAYDNTRNETLQAMEGLVHNLNTMHSRGGNQVVFSSINYGTDISPEGRMVMRELLNTTSKGLGSGEVPVFPIQIFKVRDGISYSEEDYKNAIENWDAAMAGEIKFKAPNFDLLLKACATTATSLFPNFLFLDTPFNKHEKWDINDPKRYRYELATMGCRTRVFDNLNGEKTSIGRGNLSFTSINLPRLAIKAKREAEDLYPDGDKHLIRKEAKKILLKMTKEMTAFVADQLYERYLYQRTALARQFPFMMGNDVWKGGAALAPNDEVGDVLNSGTLSIGFIGGHNAMMAIYGESHGTNQDAWECLRDVLVSMNEVVKEYKEKYHLNFSVLATPAEGLAGRFTRLDKQKFGIIEGVNDRAYYVNSFHIDVKENISLIEKIKKEAPFHALTGAGHITYVELDGEAKKNVSSILKIVKVMHDENIGYGSINHPVDTCKRCGYRGVIYSTCPLCKSEEIIRLRRITGYLTGSLESWNSAKRAEEKDRVKHH